MFRMLITGHSFFEVTVEIVEQNNPTLMGLNELEKFGVYIDNVKDFLIHDRKVWKVPLT